MRATVCSAASTRPAIRGAEPKYGPDDTQKRILALLDRPPPAGHANWTAPLLSRALGDIHEQYIWRFLRAQKIDLSRRKSWCESKDPEFAAKAAEIVGLYMAPPDNAVVLSIDEKPSIQALERAQGYLKFPERPRAHRAIARLQAPRDDDACSPPSMSPTARWSAATIKDGAGSSSWTS